MRRHSSARAGSADQGAQGKGWPSCSNGTGSICSTTDVAPGGGLSIGNVSSFGEDARGELYVTDLDDGEVFKIVPGA